MAETAGALVADRFDDEGDHGALVSDLTAVLATQDEISPSTAQDVVSSLSTIMASQAADIDDVMSHLTRAATEEEPLNCVSSGLNVTIQVIRLRFPPSRAKSTVTNPHGSVF